MTVNSPWQLTLPRLMAALGLLCLTLASIRAIDQMQGFSVLSGSVSFFAALGVATKGLKGFTIGCLTGLAASVLVMWFLATL